MTIFRRFLRDRRRSSLWWALGFFSLVAFTVAFYPSIKGQQNVDQVVKDLPPAVQAMFGLESGVPISSAPGYLHARMFASLYPILLLVLAIGLGSAAIGGSEEDGVLELLLSNPISRRRVFAERFLAMAALTFAQAAFFLAVLVPLAGLVGALKGVSVSGLVVAGLGGAALALLHGSIAFSIGASTGRRGPAIGIASATAAAGYLAQGILVAADAPAVVLNLTPWHWFLKQNLLVAGPNLAAWLPALGLSVAIAAASLPRFLSRDLR